MSRSERPTNLRGATTVPPGIGVGVLLDGTYRLTRLVGEGAMGVVYLGRDERLERDVAIKFIQPQMVRSERAHDRFLLEARAMARVHHVNVVEIHTFGEYMGSPYFVMEYVPGQTVTRFMDRRARPYLAVDEVIGILDQTCRGISAIHAVGAVHRDLKPTNVLIGPAFRVCVTDFGLVKVLDTNVEDQGDTVSGTPAYMAPEVVLGTFGDPALEPLTDVYGLGVMAFEMFTSRLPFEHRMPTDMMIAHVEDLPPTPSELRPDLPGAFDAVILGALIKDPELRTPSVEAFRQGLVQAREHAVAPAESLRILIADDDTDFCALVEETLRYAYPHADIITVADGMEAIRLAERSRPALAVIDLDMPGMNGVEVTAALRATPGLENTGIVVVTATGGAPDWRLLQTLGADGFQVKPIDPVSLLALVRRTLASRVERK